MYATIALPIHFPTLDIQYVWFQLDSQVLHRLGSRQHSLVGIQHAHRVGSLHPFRAVNLLAPLPDSLLQSQHPDRRVSRLVSRQGGLH